MVVARGSQTVWVVQEVGRVGQKVQTASYEMTKFSGCAKEIVTTVNNTVLYT